MAVRTVNGEMLIGLAPLISLATGLTVLSMSLMRRQATGRLLAIVASASSLAMVLTGGVWLIWADHPNPDIQSVNFPLLGVIQLDGLSMGWLVISSWLVLLLFLTRRPESVTLGGAAREAWLGLLLLSMSQLVVLTVNVWIQWGVVALMGWIFCFLLARDHTNGERTEAAGEALLWFTAADLLWLLGLQMVMGVSVTGSILNLPENVLWGSATPIALSRQVTGTMLLLTSLVIRCGLFPFMAWTGRTSPGLRDAAWTIAFGLGAGVLLLLRWDSLLVAFPESRLAMAGLGGLSAALLAITSFVPIASARGLVRAASGQVGLVWLALAADPRNVAWQAGLAMSTLLLIPALSLGRQELCTLRSRRLGWGYLALSLILLCSGLLGQERLFDAVRISTTLVRLDPFALLFLSLLGHGLLSFSLFQGLLLNRVLPAEPSSQHQQSGISVAVWCLSVAVTLAICMGLLAPQIDFDSVNGFQLHWPVLSAVVMLISVVAAATWSSLPASAAPTRRSLFGSIRRLAENDFYVPVVIHFAFAWPVRAATHVAQRLEQRAIGRSLHDLPVWFFTELSETASLTDEESDDRASAIHLLLAALLLCLVIGRSFFSG